MTDQELIAAVRRDHDFESHSRNGEWLYRRCSCGVDMDRDAHGLHVAEALVSAAQADRMRRDADLLTLMAGNAQLLIEDRSYPRGAADVLRAAAGRLWKLAGELNA